jgi:hypothetical protein
MKTAGRRWVVALIAAASAVAGGRWLLGCLFPADGGGVAVANQLWIERTPRHERDLVHHLALLEKNAQQRFGITGRSSRWRLEVDRVHWRWQKPGRLEVTFPQQQNHIHFDTRAWECKGEAPAPFELCLELSCDGKSVTFYSRKDWVIRPREELAEAVRSALPPLSQTLQALTRDETVADPGPAFVEGPWPFDPAP